MKTIIRFSEGFILSILLFSSTYIFAEDVDTEPLVTPGTVQQSTTGYVAKNESVQFLFNAMSSEAKRPYNLSKLAQKKTVTGDFDLSNPKKLLDIICNQIGLSWYDDGQTIYVYDNSELKNSVVMLRYASLTTLNEFLQQTGLISYRYPIRGEQKNNAFYVAGPPAYVDIVVNAAAYLDDLYRNVDLNKQRISVIKLHNTFVNDRKMMIRDQEVNVVGIGRIIENIISATRRELLSIETTPVKSAESPTKYGESLKDELLGVSKEVPREKQQPNNESQIKVIAYPDTNSLLVKGTQEQIDLIKTLIEQLDVPKRHIELSLWIIDINKTNLDKLGVNWQGAVNIGSQTQVQLNTSNGSGVTTLDGSKFLAQIYALNSQGLAEVVSRPIILTQDNVPASFDHNSTFYTKLEGERVANLESVTYGTMINVVPRFSTQGDDVEMVLDIEDGQQDANSSVNGIPTVTRTKLSTIARVPHDKSLLIGGYTLENYTKSKSKIPFLGDLPLIGGAFRSDSESMTKVVRVFLIQPKLLDSGAIWDAQKFAQPTTLAPQMPLSDTLQLLRAYSDTHDTQN